MMDLSVARSTIYFCPPLSSLFSAPTSMHMHTKVQTASPTRCSRVGPPHTSVSRFAGGASARALNGSSTRVLVNNSFLDKSTY